MIYTILAGIYKTISYVQFEKTDRCQKAPTGVTAPK